MSGLAAAEPRLSTPGRMPGSGKLATAGVADARFRLWELTMFLGFSLGAAALWGRLVADPPVGRLGAMVAICTLGAVAIASLARIARFRVLVRWVGAGLALATMGAAAVALGVPARLLLLPNWPELLENLGFGLAGIEDAELPYRDTDAWTRLSLMLGAPVLLSLAAALAFFPRFRPEWGRALALVPLVAAWGTPATLDSPPAELACGLVLFVLCAVWLWLPQIARRDLVPAAVALGVAGALAIPAAATLDRDSPWWDYESWDWFGRERGITYDWNHSYGPLEWPREGTTLLEIRSPRALYWKTIVLDRFDGFTWQRAEAADELADAELAARTTLPDGNLAERNPGWLTSAEIEVRALRSEIAVGAGFTRDVDEIDDPVRSPDGTLLLSDSELAPGDTYSIDVYAPRASPAGEMRRTSRHYPDAARGATLVALPVGSSFRPEVGPTSSTAGAGALPGGNAGDLAPSRALSFGLWGDPEPEAVRAALASEYADVYRLAKRLTADAPSAFDAAVRVESFLRTNFDYTPNVPDHTYPLASFLFGDRAGYCQQFSGAMALMLRMVGVPARVASGFAPGRYDAARGVYEVRDFDAHSWVEVYFPGIGWATFDPTPGAAPAASQAIGGTGTVVLRDQGPIPEQGAGRIEELERGIRGGTPPPAPAAGSVPWAAIGIGALALSLAASGAASVAAWRRRRGLRAGDGADRQAAELVTALRRLGWSIEPEVTLLGIERRFDRAGRRPIARYAAVLRASRYAGGGAAPPGPSERRELRRVLGAGGPGRRWRAVRAIPLGGPALRPGGSLDTAH